jgi:enoyl-CoA hydratase/carnithine racemase
VERRGAVEWITLNRPQRLNAITPTMTEELLDKFTALRDDSTVRVVVLRGAGRGFCAGLDIKEAIGSRGPDSPSVARLPDVVLAMRRCPQPVVALLHGPACGGGFAFALAADIRIAGTSARMNDAFVNLGVSGCELGVSYFLPRQVGLSVAAELMYTGRFLDAQRALAVGLVSQVVPDDELGAAAESLLVDMLRVAPLALRKTKETLQRAIGMSELEAVMALEEETQLECMRGDDFKEGLQAFVEKRAPNFASLEN